MPQHMQRAEARHGNGAQRAGRDWHRGFPLPLAADRRLTRTRRLHAAPRLRPRSPTASTTAAPSNCGSSSRSSSQGSISSGPCPIRRCGSRLPGAWRQV